LTQKPDYTQSPTIIVVGCPRSGTSPFARWLDGCGFETASDPRRTARYPKGYFEHLPILMFHKALERLPRGADHAISMEPFLRTEQLEDPFVRTCFDAAFEPLLSGALDFIKFPQLALSIDFLFEQLPNVHVIGLWRDPVPTFRSLITREFPAEMRPSSTVKSTLLWNLYAHHLVRAADTHGDRFTLISIDRFLAEPSMGPAILGRAGRNPDLAIPCEEVVDLALWHRPVPLHWKVYHAFATRLSHLVARRFDDERRVLATQKDWVSRLERASTFH